MPPILTKHTDQKGDPMSEARKRLYSALGELPKQYDKIADTKNDPPALFKKLLDRSTQFKIVPWTIRGEEIKVRIELPTLQQEEYCKTRAVQNLKDRSILVQELGPQAFEEQLSDAVAVEILITCVKDPQPLIKADGTQIFKVLFHNAQELRKALSGDEMAGLFNLFLLVKDELGGFTDLPEIMKNFDAWVDRVAVGSEHYPLSATPLPILLSILQALAMALARLRRSQPGSYQNTLDALQENSLGGITSFIEDVSEQSTNAAPKRKTTKKTKKKEKTTNALSPEEVQKLAESLK